jgi:cellulose synthase/poly-beta-1,6-N-acetylglucosamine synthase-like glycosyltransferase
LFETCNIAYRRDVFQRAGAFNEDDALVARAGRRAFGEDVLLGWRVEAGGGRVAFARAALVHHRWVPGTYRSWLREMEQLGDFAGLGRRSGAVAGAFWHKVFLSKRSASFDAALLSGATSVLTRRRWLLLGILPWAMRRWPDTRAHPGRSRLIRLAQLGLGDMVGLTSLVRGSVRHRRLLL